LALKLAPSGKRILILERGDYLPREKQNWDATRVFIQELTDNLMCGLSFVVTRKSNRGDTS